MSHILSAITQAKRKVERVNLFLNGKFWVSLSKSELVSLKLAQGDEISEETKLKVEMYSSRGKLLGKVYGFIQRRPRSVGEVREYLVFRQQIDQQEADEVIAVLQERELLSDEAFARWYVSYKTSSGVNGRNKLQVELFQKHVPKEIVDMVLNELESQEGYKDDTAEKIIGFIEKIAPTIKAKDEYDFRSKLLSRLLSRGYRYSEVKDIVKNWQSVTATTP